MLENHLLPLRKSMSNAYQDLVDKNAREVEPFKHRITKLFLVSLNLVSMQLDTVLPSNPHQSVKKLLATRYFPINQ